MHARSCLFSPSSIACHLQGKVWSAMVQESRRHGLFPHCGVERAQELRPHPESCMSLSSPLILLVAKDVSGLFPAWLRHLAEHWASGEVITTVCNISILEKNCVKMTNMLLNLAHYTKSQGGDLKENAIITLFHRRIHAIQRRGYKSFAQNPFSPVLKRSHDGSKAGHNVTFQNCQYGQLFISLCISTYALPWAYHLLSESLVVPTISTAIWFRSPVGA